VARDILKELETARDEFVAYRKVVHAIYSRIRGPQLTQEHLDAEDAMRQKLTQLVGRVLPVLRRLGVPLLFGIPAMGRSYGIFETALDADLEHSDKGHSIDKAIDVLNQAVGIVSGYSEDERRELISPREAAQPTEQPKALGHIETRLNSVESALRRFLHCLRWIAVVAVWAVLLGVFLFYGQHHWSRTVKGFYAFLATLLGSVMLALPLGRGRVTQALVIVMTLAAGLLTYLTYFRG